MCGETAIEIRVMSTFLLSCSMNDTTGLQPKSACFAKVVCCVLGLDVEWDCFLNRAWDQLLHVVVVM